jgi:hypothetical protein
MQTHGRIESKKMRAAEALRSVLTHVSGIKLRELDVEPLNPEQHIDILARVEIYGRSHTLVCLLLPNDKPEQVRETIAGFCSEAVKAAGNITPVLIAPKRTTHLLSLCREACAGMLDLDGNARIEVGDTFIACHQVPRSNVHRKEPRQQVVQGSTHGAAA